MKVIAEDFITSIFSGEKKPLYSKWEVSYKNLYNFEYWEHNKTKTFFYIFGISSSVLIPLALLVDCCCCPILGRSPKKTKPEQKEHKE